MSGRALRKSGWLVSALSLMPLLACTAGFSADQSAVVPAARQTAKTPVIKDANATALQTAKTPITKDAANAIVIQTVKIPVTKDAGATAIQTAKTPVTKDANATAIQAPENPAHKGTAGATQEKGSIPTVNVQTYLLTMQPLTQRYLQIMLSLLGWEGEVITTAQVGALGQQLAKVKAPPVVADQHANLANSLTMVNEFVIASEAKEQGFHKALLLARKMQEVSDEYHKAVLALAMAHGLPKTIDPFLAHAKPSFSAEMPISKQADTNNLHFKSKMSSGRISDRTLRALGEDDSRVSGVESSPSNSPSFINGVGGTMGISGLFNGLGGTGTNGLVDGMGVSSGMNGWVNGAGLSSGMSGLLNNNTDSGMGLGNR